MRGCISSSGPCRRHMTSRASHGGGAPPELRPDLPNCRTAHINIQFASSWHSGISLPTLPSARPAAAGAARGAAWTPCPAPPAVWPCRARAPPPMSAYMAFKGWLPAHPATRASAAWRVAPAPRPACRALATGRARLDRPKRSVCQQATRRDSKPRRFPSAPFARVSIPCHRRLFFPILFLD